MIRTDDNAPLHSKFQLAGLTAYGFWHAALSYCGRQLTDGFIDARALHLVFPSATPQQVSIAVAHLVGEGSLHKVERGHRPPCSPRRKTCPTFKAPAAGYILHDFFDYQERSSLARNKRRNLSTYGRQGGKKSAEMRQALASSQKEAEALLLSVPIRSDPKDKSSTAGDLKLGHGPNGGGPGAEPVTLTPDEERGLEYIAHARGITLAQCRSELITAKLREREGKT